MTSRVSVSFIGQPATVRKIAAATRPASSTSTDLTMPSSVMGLRISGSLTFESAVSSASLDGSTVVGTRPSYVGPDDRSDGGPGPQWGAIIKSSSMSSSSLPLVSRTHLMTKNRDSSAHAA